MLLWNLNFIGAANELHCVSIDLTDAISYTTTTTQLDCVFELFDAIVIPYKPFWRYL